MNQRGQAQVLILAGIVLLVALAGGIFYMGRVTAPKPLSQNPVVTSSPSPTLSPITSPDPTASWKRYTNTQFGFSIKYQPQWTIYEQSLTSDNWLSALIFTLYPPGTSYDPALVNVDGMISLWVHKDNSRMKVIDWVRKNAGNNSLLPDNYYRIINIDGYEAVRIDYTQTPEIQRILDAKGASGGLGGPPPNGYKSITVYLKKNNSIFNLQVEKLNGASEPLETFNQILSTFRFLP